MNVNSHHDPTITARPGPETCRPSEADSGTMEALILDGGAALARRPRPSIRRPTDVLIEIQAAGLCRTDLYVADGTILAAPCVVLGHEAAGLVRATGPDASYLTAGTLVGLDPRVPCLECTGCQASGADDPAPKDCLMPKRLGIEIDGVFADQVVVPAACVHPIADGVDPLRAAYLEPVAAAMGALSAGLHPEDHGIIAGNGRIAELTARILEHAGFPRPTIVALQDLNRAVRPGSLDFVIDAGLPDNEALAAMTQALRKHGTLVLKSRAALPRSFVPADWVAREVTVAARAYGSFRRAAEAVADPSLLLDDLFGEARALAAFEQVFAEARLSESVKLFFRPSAIESNANFPGAID